MFLLSIINNLLSILEEKNLKQTDLCNAININTSTMTNWKNRNTDPPAKYIIPICEYLEITPYELLCNKKNIIPEKLSDDELNLLKMYRLLTEWEKGEYCGQLKEKTKDRVEEI